MKSKIMNDWLPSNYPIFLALVLLAVTAATLAIGDEKQAEELAIYAYYFLVTGIAIHFFELALPGYTLQWLSQIMKHISAFIKQHPQKAGENIQKIIKVVKPHYLKLQRLQIEKPEKNIVVISDISRNIAIFLSVFFIISLIYGWMIDWWFVERYLSDLVLFILGFLTLHIFTRVRF